MLGPCHMSPANQEIHIVNEICTPSVNACIQHVQYNWICIQYRYIEETSHPREISPYAYDLSTCKWDKIVHNPYVHGV
jgi:hypothetical protein